MIQYAAPFEICVLTGDYWIPAFAGMTAIACWQNATLSHKGRGEEHRMS
jgi:hypothetical protein